MQDMEFTVENEKLYMLQTRNGKRTAAAAIKIACDLIENYLLALLSFDNRVLGREHDTARRRAGRSRRRAHSDAHC